MQGQMRRKNRLQPATPQTILASILFDDFGNNPRPYSSAAFTNRESQSLFDCDRGDQADRHHDVVARHAHLCAFRKLQIAGYVCCSEIELRSVSIEERSMSAAFFLLQYVYLSFELSMRMNGARLAQYLSSFDFVSLYTS